MLRQYELVDKVLAYDPAADEALINRAYVYATKMHGNQLRHSGDPYFSHPIEVAGILTDLRLDAATIVTGLLHDTIEDTDATSDELSSLFGGEVAELVDGVTKLSQLEWDSEDAKQAENFRKFLLAMSNDIRVLLVKLADRLHNMRTLHHHPKEKKRRRIAQETLDIYAPLAGRMGMHEFREELEDLSFQVINPEARAVVENRLEDFRSESGDVIDRIRERIIELYADSGLQVEVHGRQKRPFSIWRKMQRQASSLEQLSDIFAFRVLVADEPSCYQALGILHRRWPSVPGRFKDYISTPKNNGYRSIHTTIVGPEQKRVEIQLRTRDMHDVAEHGIAAHWIYKDADAKTPGETYVDTFGWLQQLVEMLEHGSSAEEFLEHSKLQLFTDQVFCFTPKGRLINLPRGATALDFAYAVHTQIGDTCVGCKINGPHMPLRTRLKNGDEVEIVRSDAQRPLPIWENYVETGKARSAIRRALRQTQFDEFVLLGRQMVRSLFEAADKGSDDQIIERALGALGYKNLDDLFAAVGEGVNSAHEVFEQVFPGEAKGKSWAKKKTKKSQSADPLNAKPLVRLREGVRGHAIRFAKDTFPLPGDRIVGILTPGEGVVVYPIASALLEKFEKETDRWVDVAWDIQDSAAETFVTRFSVRASNEVGALGAIATLIADYEGNINNMILAQRDVDFYDIELDIDVHDLKHANRIVNALNGLTVVNAVARV
jgi:GTP diphosphokinase / guanosine-3',5'-bis(diphosphate) 3'-diphosphatase